MVEDKKTAADGTQVATHGDTSPSNPPTLVQNQRKHGGVSPSGSLCDAKRVPLQDQEFCRAMGRLDATGIFEQISAAFSTAELKSVRDNKLYLRGGYKSFEDFVDAELPLARRTYEERIQNFETLGPKFVQWADRNKLTVRVMRSLRQLPAGEIKKFCGRVERGEATDEELVAMAYDYHRRTEEQREVEQSLLRQGEKIGYLQDKAKKGGEEIAKRDEDIKKLKAELKIAQNPKSLTEEQKAKACADAKQHFHRGLSLVRGIDLSDADVHLRASVVGMLAEATTALTNYERLYHLEAVEGRDDE